MDTKKDPDIYCLQETHFRHRDTYRLKVRGMDKDIQCNWKSKECWSRSLISDKIDFKIKNITETKKENT